MSARLAAVAAAALALSLATPVKATHEVNHRYVILGYVRDATGRPLARTVVQVVREKAGLAYEAKTDGDGFYLVILHLHDEDVFEPLRVAAGRAALRVEARFDPLDSRTPRGTSVNFTGGVARDQPKEFAAALERYVGK